MVAQMIAHPSPANSTTLDSWLVCQDRNLWHGKLAYLPRKYARLMKQ